jgi:hypothetical protein
VRPRSRNPVGASRPCIGGGGSWSLGSRHRAKGVEGSTFTLSARRRRCSLGLVPVCAGTCWRD